MRKILPGLTVLLLLACPAAVRAQDGLRLAEVQVELWPEFDQPAVLVICRITLAPETSLPATLRLHIPAGAAVNAVAFQGENGKLFYASHEQELQPDWLVLTIQSDNLNVQVEYYDALEKDSSSRRYQYIWPGDYAVEAFSVIFQQPVDSTNLVLDPPAIESWAGNDGLSYHRSASVRLAAGQTFTLAASYEKENDKLSGSGVRVVPAGSLEPGASNAWPWVLGGLGAVLLLGGVIGGFFWLGGRRRSTRQPRRRRIPRSQADEPGVEAVHCHQCGARAQPGDNFCRTCGARLRR